MEGRRLTPVVVIALGAGGLWLSTRPHTDAALRAGPVTYVAVGDSVASGHGLGTARSPAPGERPYVAGVGCQRSAGTSPETSSYSDLVASALQQRRSVVRYEKLSCTGHTTADLLAVQLPRAQAALGDANAVVTITIGANNYRFWQPRTYLSLFDPRRSSFDAWRQPIEAGVRRDVVLALERLGRGRPNRLLLVTEYFDPYNAESFIYDLVPLCARGADGGAPAVDCRARLAAAIAGLNRALADAVESYRNRRLAYWARAELVDHVVEAFGEHAAPQPFCGRARPQVADSWIQSPPRPLLLQALVGEQRVGVGADCFHPNAAGHRELARLVLARL